MPVIFITKTHCSNNHSGVVFKKGCFIAKLLTIIFTLKGVREYFVFHIFYVLSLLKYNKLPVRVWNKSYFLNFWFVPVSFGIKPSVFKDLLIRRSRSSFMRSPAE